LIIMADMSMHAASDLLQHVGELAVTAKRVRAELEALLSPTAVMDTDADTERMIYFTLAEVIEHGLTRPIEAARDAIKGMHVAEAEVWLRRQLEELGEN